MLYAIHSLRIQDWRGATDGRSSYRASMTSIEQPIPPAETMGTNAQARKGFTLSLIRLSRVGVGALMLVTIALFCVGIPARVNELANLPESTRNGLAQIGLSVDVYVLYNIFFEIALFLGYA